MSHHIDDVDLIIADARRVILIEAKAFEDWDPEQLTRKFARLHRLLGSNNVIYDIQGHYFIEIFFVLMSRKGPPKEGRIEWPLWAQREGAPVFVEMKTSHAGYVKKTVRCDDRGKECATGTYWKTKEMRV